MASFFGINKPQLALLDAPEIQKLDPQCGAILKYDQSQMAQYAPEYYQ